VLEPEGNPSAGCRWTLNGARSENLGILRIEDLIYRPDARRKSGCLLARRSAVFSASRWSQSAAQNSCSRICGHGEGKAIKNFEQRVDLRGN